MPLMRVNAAPPVGTLLTVSITLTRLTRAFPGNAVIPRKTRLGPTQMTGSGS